MTSSRTFSICAVLLALITATTACFPRRGTPGAFEVTVGDDAVDASPGDGRCRSTLPGGACTLRAAVQESNALAGTNTVFLGRRTHSLTLPEELAITGPVHIQGNGVSASVIDGRDRGPGVFTIGRAEAWLSDLTVTRGGPTVPSGGAFKVDDGGFLSLNTVAVTENESFSSGGAIHLENGTLLLLDTSVSNNSATGAFAGGLYIDSLGIANIDRSTFERNTSNRSGAITNFGRLTITNSTISGNIALSDLRGTGGIVNARTASLNNVTIYGNTSNAFADAQSSGGMNSTSAATTTISNTIIAGNTRGSRANDCVGSYASLGYNLLQTTEACTLSGTLTGNITGRNPDLLPLGTHFGAATRAHLAGASSPIIGAGHPQAGPGVPTRGRCEARDQSNRLRQLTGAGRRCDIGSIEVR